MFEELHDEFKYCFYHLNDYRGLELWYYNSTEPRLKTKTVDRACDLLSKYQELIEKVERIFNSLIVRDMDITDISEEREKLTIISEYVNDLFEGDIGDFACFSEQNIIDDYLEAYYAEAYDEYLDEYIDKAINLAKRIRKPSALTPTRKAR